jgi:hypothetical protein
MDSIDMPRVPEAVQQQFFEAMHARARQAQRVQPCFTQDIAIAGMHIRLVFAGEAMRDALWPALAHRATDSGQTPDAVLNIWDSRSSGIDVPPPPCARSQFTDRGDIWGFESRRILSAFHWLECSLALLDAQTLEGIYWVDDPAALPYWAKASPLRTLLHWLMRARGHHLLHAAAIGTTAGGILITGKGGIGKSTTALLGLEAGMAFIGDDYVVVSLDPQPMAHALYSTAKLDPNQAARFPRLAAARRLQGEGEKTVFHLYPEWSAQMPSLLPLRAIATTVFMDRAETDILPADEPMILRAASFTTLAHLPRADQSSHAFIARLVAALPRSVLRLGRDTARIPGVVMGFLAAPAAATNAAPTGVAASARRDEPPLISVIIPAYNSTCFLPEAVASVLAQDYPALDILVVDDGSPEDVVGRVGALIVDVRLIRQDNAGPAAARNRGIREALGDYLAFLDVDDLWPAGNLHRLLACLEEEPEAVAVIGRGQLVRSAEGEVLTYIGNPAESFPHAIGAALFRRKAFSTVGLFDPQLRFGEDTDWFERAAEGGHKVLRLEETTLLVRRHETNVTRGKNLVELNMLKVFKKKLDRARGSAFLPPPIP